MKKVYVELRDVAGEFENIVLEIDPADNQLGMMWFNALQYNLENADNKVEKSHMLKGWASGTKLYNHPGIRDANTLCNEMNWAIERINMEMGEYHNYPRINMKWNLSVLDSPVRFREAANEIHHHFEILIGQVWEVSEWFKKNMSHKTRHAIRWINNVVHQMEALGRSSRSKGLFCSLNNVDISKEHTPMVRFPLGQGCYQHFQREAAPLTVVAYYCQLGKRHFEAFIDQDEFIDRENISGVRYVSGEFIITLTRYEEQRGFNEWLVDNDFDPTDITQGYGHGIMGKVVNYTENDIEEIMKRNDIYKITTDDSYKTISRTYNYTWQDEQDYIINHLEGSMEVSGEDPYNIKLA